MSGFEVVTLRNGHKAVRDTVSGEVMHPSVGPWAEANLLYVRQAKLSERLLGSAPFVVLDVGLGGAANVAAVLDAWRALPAETRRPLRIHSFERDMEPLELSLKDEAGFPFLAPHRDALTGLLREKRHAEAALEWFLYEGELPGTLGHVENERAHLVLFDPFSPESNPSLWTSAAFARIRALCSDDCALYTYSASTPVRVSMLLGGFFVGAGDPVGTKAETTAAATSLSLLERPLGQRFLERWSRSSAQSPFGEERPPDLEARLRSHPQFAGR